MINLASFQSYDLLFNSLKQLPSLNSSGFSNVAGAYMATKYGRSINNALSSDLGTVMKSFRNDALNLSKEARNLTSQTDRVAIATSANEVSGFSTNGQLANNSTIHIDQLASKQTTQGSPVTAKQKTALAAGNYDLTITSGNERHEISVTIQAGESSGSVLNKTAKAINDMGAGTKARVASDALGNQQLLIESENTGKKNSFTVGGALVDALGLNQTTQAAADAKFTYNGKSYQTDSNSVTLDSGKTKLELKDTTDSAVALTKAADTSGIPENVTALVSAYNSFQDTLKSASDNKALRIFSQQLDQLVSQNTSALEGFGITKNSNGELAVDQEQLETGISDNPEAATNLFVSKDSLADKLQSKTEQLLKTPASTLLDLPSVTANSPAYQRANSGFVNPLGISAQSSGNLFDLLL